MKSAASIFLLARLFIAPSGGASAQSAVAAVLDDWHAAAAERWTLEEFRRYAHPYFGMGRAWTFKPSGRHVSISRDGAVAWFDEALDTPNLGPARGSGVLVKIKGAWKITHYNLSVPIPNGLLKEFKERIETYSKSAAPAR